MQLLTAQQMRDLEKEEMTAGRQSGLQLMERAGQGVVDAIFARWPKLSGGASRALILCGPGNNGGDGFVIARLLDARGWHVNVFLFGDGQKLPPDARVNHDRWTESHTVKPWDPAAICECERPDVIVDAVFGIGLTRPLPPDVAEVLADQFCQSWPDPENILKIAVDCPSGLNLDTGTVPQNAPPEKTGSDTPLEGANSADLTVAFHCPKPGHYLAQGPSLCGAVSIVDIGLQDYARDQRAAQPTFGNDRARLVPQESTARWPLQLIGKGNSGGHKYDHGHAFVFSGGPGRGGAARLAARAALRSGAGLVTVLCPPDALAENAAALDAVMLRSLAPQGALTEMADDRVTAFCLGPGLGLSHGTRERVLETLAIQGGDKQSRRPAVVLDADALTVFADDPARLFSATHDRTILTPHEGEFTRLFPDLALSKRNGRSKIDIARAAAARAGCLVLLKGPDTVITSPDGRASLHAASYDREVPWLATAGAGDVLAGLIAGLAASDAASSLHDMAEVAVWLHVEAARSFGPGLIAEDLPDQLPVVLRALDRQAAVRTSDGIASAVPSSIPSA